jgi:hypothetical protein
VKFISHTVVQMMPTVPPGHPTPTAEDRKERMERYKISFIKKFGQENVSYNETTRYFTLKQDKKVIASAPLSSTEWKFLIIEDDRQKELLKTVLPPEILAW